MKKIFSVILAISVIASLSACAKKDNGKTSSDASSTVSSVSGDGSSYASDGPAAASSTVDAGRSVTISTENASVKSGSEFSVPVKFGENAEIAALTLVISYDSEKLTFNTFEKNSAFGLCEYNEKDPGSIYIAMITTDPVKEAVELGNLKFTAKEGVSGETTVHMSYTDCLDEESRSLSVEISDAKITIS